MQKCMSLIGQPIQLNGSPYAHLSPKRSAIMAELHHGWGAMEDNGTQMHVVHSATNWNHWQNCGDSAHDFKSL